MEKKQAIEEWAIQTVITLFGEQIIDKVYEPNGYSKCPDYLLQFKNKQVITEIVLGNDFRIKKLIDDEKAELEKRALEDSSVDLQNKIFLRVEKVLKPSESIILFVNEYNLPLYNSKRAKLIAPIVKDAYLKGHFVLDKTVSLNSEIGLGGLLISNNRRESFVGFIFTGVLNSHSIGERSLSMQAKYILLIAIEEKAAKIKNVNAGDWKIDPDFNKWLVIINTNVCLELTDFINAYRELLSDNLSALKFFEKIFIVCNNKAHDLSKNLI